MFLEVVQHKACKNALIRADRYISRPWLGDLLLHQAVFVFLRSLQAFCLGVCCLYCKSLL